jgi:hypothetical protein
MTATEIRPKKAAKTLDPKLLETARQVIKNTDWNAYWRQVDEGVTQDVEAYARARARSREEFNHLVLL